MPPQYAHSSVFCLAAEAASLFSAGPSTVLRESNIDSKQWAYEYSTKNVCDCDCMREEGRKEGKRDSHEFLMAAHTHDCPTRTTKEKRPIFGLEQLEHLSYPSWHCFILIHLFQKGLIIKKKACTITHLHLFFAQKS